MQAVITYNQKQYKIDFTKPLDISLSLRGDDKNPVAWYLKAPKITPVQEGDWVGRVSKGGSVNFNNIQFNPHAHTTHTESVGHITPEFHGINESIITFFFSGKLISIEPEKSGIDEVITKAQLKCHFREGEAQAVIIRTLPNSIAKRSKHYSHTNWPYLEEEAAVYLRECGVDHLLIDLPSVDREEDGGRLLAHKAFWNYPKHTRFHATVTELVYVPSRIEDGFYFLNLQPASFENDASPSRPVLYKPEML